MTDTKQNGLTHDVQNTLTNGTMMLPDGVPQKLADWMPNGTTSNWNRQSKAKTIISERSIDEPRPIKMIYIGAGVSGIVGAIEFIKRVPNLQLVIYEKNPEVGGTWFENRYPGCACGKSRVQPIEFGQANKGRRALAFLPAELRVVAKVEALFCRCSRDPRVLEEGGR